MHDLPPDGRLDAPATHRNREPILEALRRVLAEARTVLEIGSGTGQHAAFLAPRLPGVRWIPSDPDPASRASIAAWAAHEGAGAVAPPLDLDVRRRPWPVAEVDAVFSANMIHIAPWEACEALVAGAAEALAAGGRLVLYGPFRLDGAHTAESNARFDASLRSRNPAWGVRDLEAVTALAEAAGLGLVERIPMPANNQVVVFARA